MLRRGVSSLLACDELGVSIDAIERTREFDDEFRNQLHMAIVGLSQNVMTALYREAVKGNVTAQRFWLQHHPPPDWWDRPDVQPPSPEMKGLTDEELVKLAATWGVDDEDRD